MCCNLGDGPGLRNFVIHHGVVKPLLKFVSPNVPVSFILIYNQSCGLAFILNNIVTPPALVVGLCMRNIVLFFIRCILTHLLMYWFFLGKFILQAFEAFLFLETVALIILAIVQSYRSVF